MIQFPCPGCQTVFKVTDDKAGKKGKCPKCQSPFTIPQPDAAAAAPPPAPKTDPNLPVEIEPCPGCQAVLTVAAEFIGADVECPNCQTVFTAARPGTKPKPKPVAPPPPPPPPAPANAFSGFGEESADEEEEAPKPKKGKSKAKIDLGDEEDEAPRKKSKRAADDDEPSDDEDDFERAGPTKDKAKKGKNGLLLAAGIVHIVFALGNIGCNSLNIFAGMSCLTLVGISTAAKTIDNGNDIQNHVDNVNKMGNKPKGMTAKELEESMRTSEKLGQKYSENINNINNLNKTVETAKSINLGIWAGSLIAGLLAAAASIGCLMRKTFGKLLTFGSGGYSVFLQILAILIPIVLIGTSVLSVWIFVANGFVLLLTVAYAGFTSYAVVKGYKKETGEIVTKKKLTRNDDEPEAESDEDDLPPPPKKGKKVVEDEDEDDLPPPPKKGKKKVVVEDEDEDDDLPPPPKKKAGGNDFAFDDDEDEAPKPKKKKPRRDDDD